jgi:hypothetical protein
MNKEPITLEQLLVACAVLSAHPSYRDVVPATIIEKAYNFVRGCQERLPQLAQLESERDRRDAEKGPYWPKGPTVPFKQAAASITGRKSPRRAALRFWQFLSEDPNYDQVRQLLKERGVPKKDFKSLQRDFSRWDSITKRAAAQANAEKRRKKT